MSSLTPEDGVIDEANLSEGEAFGTISTSKVARSVITSMAAAKIGSKLVVQKGRKIIAGNSLTDKQQLEDEHEIGKMLLAALTQLRGTALKVSQMLSSEVDLLPQGIRDELAKSCYQVTPLNRALINKVFLNEFDKSPSSVFEKFNAKAFAAASLGQVHRAITDSGQDLAVKIQYPGIASAIKNDIKMLRSLFVTLSKTTELLPHKAAINDVLDEIQERLIDEVDYTIEAANTQWFKEALGAFNQNIVVPSVALEYSGLKVLSTEFIKGLHLEEWLRETPSQEQKNTVGQLIFDTFIHSAFELKCLHADPHPGNYLFMSNDKVALLDFGCIKKFTDSFPAQKATLINTFMIQDKKDRAVKMFDVYRSQEMIDYSVSFEYFSKELLPLVEPMYDWLSLPFLNTQYDFSNFPSVPKISIDEAKTANKFLHKIPKEHIFFDRSLFGILAILKQLGAVVNTKNNWLYYQETY